MGPLLPQTSPLLAFAGQAWAVSASSAGGALRRVIDARSRERGTEIYPIGLSVCPLSFLWHFPKMIIRGLSWGPFGQCCRASRLRNAVPNTNASRQTMDVYDNPQNNRLLRDGIIKLIGSLQHPSQPLDDVMPQSRRC